MVHVILQTLSQTTTIYQSLDAESVSIRLPIPYPAIPPISLFYTLQWKKRRKPFAGLPAGAHVSKCESESGERMRRAYLELLL